MTSVLRYSPRLKRRQNRGKLKKVQFADTSPKSGVEFKSIKIITPNNSSENLYVHGKDLRPLVYNHIRCIFNLEKDPKIIATRAIEEKIYLENILCSQFAILGLIRVKNIDFTKEITVRYTTNNWKTHRDIWADYVSSSADKTTDKFTFRISIYSWLFEDRCDIEFALCYRVNGMVYWDNNNGNNYCISCTKSFRL